MNSHIFAVTLEVEDRSESAGEDLEEWLEDVLRENTPSDLDVHIVSFEEVEE